MLNHSSNNFLLSTGFNLGRDTQKCTGPNLDRMPSIFRTSSLNYTVVSQYPQRFSVSQDIRTTMIKHFDF